MPELPEVETIKRGLLSLIDDSVAQVYIHQKTLRFPIPPNLVRDLPQQRLLSIERRAKYLLFQFSTGSLLIHLGMSGRLSLLASGTPLQKHDHFEIYLASGRILRFLDPRRFGCVLWLRQGETCFLLDKLGIEPLSEDFDATYLYQYTRRKCSVKSLLMDSHIVVGIGNIYANEILFSAKIHPLCQMRALKNEHCTFIVSASKEILQKAIVAGGSSLRDFVHADGSMGYFQQHYFVYGRDGLACRLCRTLIQKVKIAQRSSFFCPACQRA